MTENLRKAAIDAVSLFASQWPQLFLAIAVIILLGFTLWDGRVNDARQADAQRKQNAAEAQAWRALFREMAEGARMREQQVAAIAKRIADNGERITALLTQMLDMAARLERRVERLEMDYYRLAPRQYQPHHSGQ